MSVHVCDTCRDQPGSDTAREKGCTCPVMDRLFLPCSCPTSLADNIGRRIQHDEDGCCSWTGAVSGGGQGYGYARFGGKVERIHRVVFRHARGPVREGMVLHHKCGNTLCVKPNHLLECTNAENLGFERGVVCASGRHEMDGNRMNDGRCRACHREKARRSNWTKGWVEPASPEALWLGCRCTSHQSTQSECPVHRDYHACDGCFMQPGSDSAIRLGCTCGPMDNGRGHNEHRRVVIEGCPVHWPTEEQL